LVRAGVDDGAMPGVVDGVLVVDGVGVGNPGVELGDAGAKAQRASGAFTISSPRQTVPAGTTCSAYVIPPEHW
jgi:hypothetical protein